MKKLLLVALTAFLVLPGMSQSTTTPQPKKEKPTPEMRAKRVTEKMSTELVLTADQKTKVHVANLSYFRKMAEIRTKHTDSKSEGAKTERKVARQELDKNYKTILTAEQYNKLKEHVKAKKKRAKVEKK